MNPATGIPPLSVVLPVYNAAPFLGDALNSILAQDFADFECIAINDGSTDGSGEILNEYGRRDARLRVIDQCNVGLVETLNRGVLLSRAPLVARMDADDVCLPGRFTAQMRHFEGRSDLGVLGGQIKLIDEKRRLMRLVDYPAYGKELETFLYTGSPVAHPAVMFRKSAVQEVGLYRKAFRHAEDYDLWLRVHDAGYSIENLKVPLIEYRQHAGNVSVVHRREQALATLAARCAHRCRLAGLPDPTANLDRLDEKVFELFPTAVIAHFQDDLFSVRVGINSFETEEQSAQALLAFERLPANLQRTRSGTSFLMQAGWGAWRHRRYSSAAALIFRAIAIAPVKVALIVAQKLTRSLPRWLSETARQSREELSSPRASGE
jgi:glycosyltransferase involved in cell wall biosynthesis